MHACTTQPAWLSQLLVGALHLASLDWIWRVGGGGGKQARVLSFDVQVVQGRRGRAALGSGGPCVLRGYGNGLGRRRLDERRAERWAAEWRFEAWRARTA